MAKRQIYMDNNATTPLHPEVKRTMAKTMDAFGNPSSLHTFGRQARGLVEEAREKIASFIGAAPEEIIFTGSGSEANNTVLSMFSCRSRQCEYSESGRTEIITSTIEHPCILETGKCLQDRGTPVTYLSADCLGKVNIEQLKKIITKRTGLVSVMMANNEIGTTQDIKAFCKIAHQHGALFHTDAVQAVGKIPVNVQELNVDFLTISGHKIYGPKGIGALFVKKGICFCPLIRGGHQERGRRAGTENTLGIIGLAKAIEMRAKEMQEEDKRLLKLKTTLKDGIENKIPHVRFNGHPFDCLAGTLNVSFDSAEGEAILLYLDLEGIAVSTGSACASGSLDPSHVLLATGVEMERVHGSIRLSLGRESTMKDIEYVLEVLPRIIERIRKMSTVPEKRE
ncbi:MAG: aminotransferase class V-fold PLP-dependent enzyme [Candidatus Omnitrophica bacterium]|nr:aminotransferase class V-fold PLP-dependent enzyme [Candidatus Omnitrophota bacterium]